MTIDRKKVFHLCSYIFMGIILCPWSYLGCAAVMCCAILWSFGIEWIKKKFNIEKVHSAIPDKICSVCCLIGMIATFTKNWQYSGTMAEIAGFFRMPVGLFLLLGCVILSVGAFFAVSETLSVVAELLRRGMHSRWDMSAKIGIVLGISVAEYFLAYFTICGSVEFVFAPTFLWLVWNLSFPIVINLFLVCIFRSYRIGLIANSVIVSLWSLINSYVMRYHGSPFYLSELRNVGTGLTYLSDYSLEMSNTNLMPVLFLCGSVCFLIRVFKTDKVDSKADVGEKCFSYHKISRKKSGLIGLVAVLLSIVMVTGYDPLRNSNIYNCIMGVSSYGFTQCFWDNVYYMYIDYRMPDGYDAANIAMEETSVGEAAEEYPDLIFILNETFCDLDKYTDICSDSGFFTPFYEIEGSYTGQAVTFANSGATNNSEFEYLTSKSSALLPRIAPFTYVDFRNSPDSVVLYAKKLGYLTNALHYCTSCYSRNVALPDMGFDNIYCGAVMESGSNGNRKHLDRGEYERLISFYGENGGKPSLYYLLTSQNHGGYEQNPPEADTVHTTEDFGELTDDINEYLSSMSLSVEAFLYLTEYFESVDRPVIICMVGDHTPWFVQQLPTDRFASVEEKQIAQNTVPYILWSNYGVDFSDAADRMNITDLVPTVLKAAGLPLSPFYAQILKLQKQFPVRTAQGLLVGSDGTIEKYDPFSTDIEVLRQYFYMEYNSMNGGEEYLRELFLPAVP